MNLIKFLTRLLGFRPNYRLTFSNHEGTFLVEDKYFQNIVQAEVYCNAKIISLEDKYGMRNWESKIEEL